MIAYLIKRVLYAIPILIGVNIITFLLFFMVNSPNDMARAHLGARHITPAQITLWKVARGYDKPYFYNPGSQGVGQFTDTLFFNKSLSLFTFDFGRSDSGRDISQDISTRMWPSLALAVPTLLLGLVVNIFLALFVVLFRATVFDRTVLVLCVVLMSISSLFYIILGQYVFAKLFELVPISGYQSGFSAIKFLILPVAIGVISGMGAGIRWYRTLFLENMYQEYVKTARAKGLSAMSVMLRHVLKNAMIPILTGVVVIIPMLFMGSLVMESFFGIPGLGSYTIDAISQQDFEVVRAMVFIGTLLYLVGLILTDLSYTWVDPRVRLGKGAQ